MSGMTVVRQAATIGLEGIRDCREMYRGRARKANLEGVPEYTREFLVRTSVINPNMVYVSAAPGIAWREGYPDDPNAVLVESSVSQDGESPFHYKVSYTYRHLDETNLIPWNRPAILSFSGSLASVPAFWHYSTAGDNSTKTIIVNSAGDPLSGLDRDEAEFTVTIQYNQRPPFDFALAKDYVGAINSDQYSGCPAKTWKCQSITANRKFEVIPNVVPTAAPVKVFYYETSITLAYRETTWDLLTWDVGFNEVVNGQRRKILAGSEPVSEPVALQNGAAKPPGQPPNQLQFRVYKVLPFSTKFEGIPLTSAAGFTGWPYVTT